MVSGLSGIVITTTCGHFQQNFHWDEKLEINNRYFLPPLKDTVLEQQCHLKRSIIVSATTAVRFADGHDVKSLALNLASVLLILVPFVAYFFSEILQTWAAVVAASFVVAVLLPPFGWRRPHPYSDDPSNYPYTIKKSD
eukprot:scaffold1580_cov116-Cylindrotheca_fusiformis.AAC.14